MVRSTSMVRGSSKAFLLNALMIVQFNKSMDFADPAMGTAKVDFDYGPIIFGDEDKNNSFVFNTSARPYPLISYYNQQTNSPASVASLLGHDQHGRPIYG
jgi:hypothetical protein